jgi:ABC-type Fe3+/spermidine/putrescine transport system ATPase subunit
MEPLHLRAIRKSYPAQPQAVQVLDGITLSIQPGELFFLLGPSGCGKTTLLRCLAGLDFPTAGSIFFGERDVTHLAPHRRETAMVFQSYALWPHLTVEENIAFGLVERKIPAAERSQRVEQALRSVRLEGLGNRAIDQLSGGQQQRVALARAIVTDAGGGGGSGSSGGGGEGAGGIEQVLMYDEPTAGLDPVASTVVEDLIRSMHQQQAQQEESQAQGNPPGISAYIVVTHQHSTIRRAADRLVFLHQGRVVWQGSTAEFDTTDEPIVRQFAEGSLEGPIAYV